MTRSECLDKINSLMDQIQDLRKIPAATSLQQTIVNRQIALLTDHRQDLQSIYYAHLYKLP